MPSANVSSSDQTPSQIPNRISLWEATIFWLKLGLISFGGPAGQIAIMHQELVEKRRWISERRFLHALNYCMLLPGPEAQQLATYIGWLMHKSIGGLIAGILFLAPSLLILIALSWIYIQYGDVAIVAGLFYGIKPAVIAIVLHAAYRIGTRTLSNSILIAIAVCSFVAIFAAQVAFPLIVIAAAMVGYLGGRIRPQIFTHDGHSMANESDTGSAIIDDSTPAPKHAQFSAFKCVKVVVIGVTLWCVPMALLTSLLSWEHTYTQMGWFFTKAALVTFGGAYAVLPYVYQGAVDTYAWVTPLQMMDGLALGETTPGPLIMVVAFVGFMGGHIHQVWGPDQLFLAAASAACIVTWFTFLPSFLFIFAGGPLIESTHNDIHFTAPLTAITAAVVGVIVNLACFFAYHVLWNDGFAGSFDISAATLTIAAAVALIVYKQNILKVIVVSAAIGLILQTAIA